ncbi:MAG: ornithine cyclodeaminase family protein [Anaerolineae bacterium]
MPILIREPEVEKLLPMSQALVLVEEALRAMGEGRALNRPRQRVRGEAGVLHVMPAALPDKGYMGFKAYTAFHGKAQFYFHLFDVHTGEYLAIMEADRLGQIRTGAASGVATRYLARADAQTVGIYGAGWQASSQLAAVCGVRQIRSVRCYSRDPERRRAFADRMSNTLNVPVEPVDDPQKAAQDRDIVITITSAAEPVLLGRWLAPGAHVNAAGSNWPQRREVDSTVITRSSAIFVDSLEQARLEAGDLIQPVAEGLLDWDRVHEIGALLANKVPGRTQPADITLFKSGGIAVEDVAVAGWVYEQARAAGIGERLPL